MLYSNESTGNILGNYQDDVNRFLLTGNLGRVELTVHTQQVSFLFLFFL
jgi:hypothetical protein